MIYFRDLQQRIPNELLSALATSLVEGPIFEIVSSLTEVQNVTEKQLFRERLQVLRGHSRKSNAKMILDWYKIIVLDLFNFFWTVQNDFGQVKIIKISPEKSNLDTGCFNSY